MSSKRWIVTYTKHVKQKRKVYQDGFLELSGSGAKVILHDDCEKIIDSRFLKKDEMVECGGMLAFEMHLVDIGDLDKSEMPQKDLNVGGNDVKLDEGAGDKDRSTLESLRPENRSNFMHGNRGGSMNIRLERRSALHKSDLVPNNMGVKKQNEHNCSARQSHQDAPQTALKEWNALYTTQKTQKSKKYHDGIIRLINCGSHMDQITLLNEDGAVLSSKYLKSVECLETGHTCEFPNYLVDICEQRNCTREDVMGPESINSCKLTYSRKDSVDKTLPKADRHESHSEQIQGDNRSDGQSTRLNNRQIRDEWNVLYTTQKTLKSKRYHDGIIRFINCGSHMNQITLLNEDGAVLSRKYLKPVECLETGHTCEFPNYLVEICERRNCIRDDIDKNPLKHVTGQRSISSCKLTGSREGYIDKMLPKDRHESHSEQIEGSSRFDGHSTKLNERPIRDACQILSTLKRPSPKEPAYRKLSVQDSHMPYSSDSIVVDVESNSKVAELGVPVTTNSRQIMEDKHEGKCQRLDTGRAVRITTSGSSCLKSKASCGTSNCDKMVLDSDHQGTSLASEYPIQSKQLSPGLDDRISGTVSDGNSLQYSSNREQHYADSISPVKDDIIADENRSLSDQLMTLQQEWTTLAKKVSTIGQGRRSISFLQEIAQADEISKTYLPSNALPADIEEIVSLSKESLNADDCPTFDLGFE